MGRIGTGYTCSDGRYICRLERDALVLVCSSVSRLPAYEQSLPPPSTLVCARTSLCFAPLRQTLVRHTTAGGCAIEPLQQLLRPLLQSPSSSTQASTSVMGTLAVFQLLTQALTPDPAVQRSAEAQLSQWEGQPGFCTCLAVRFCFATGPHHRLKRPTAGIHAGMRMKK